MIRIGLQRNTQSILSEFFSSLACLSWVSTVKVKKRPFFLFSTARQFPLRSLFLSPGRKITQKRLLFFCSTRNNTKNVSVSFLFFFILLSSISWDFVVKHLLNLSLPGHISRYRLRVRGISWLPTSNRALLSGMAITFLPGYCLIHRAPCSCKDKNLFFTVNRTVLRKLLLLHVPWYHDTAIIIVMSLMMTQGETETTTSTQNRWSQFDKSSSSSSAPRISTF